MNIIGGRSSMYQLAGISTSPVSCPLTSGFIHVSAFTICQSTIILFTESIISHLLRIISTSNSAHTPHNSQKPNKENNHKTHILVHRSSVLNQYASQSEWLILWSYSIPYCNNNSAPSLLVSHQGATLPLGVFPWQNSVNNLKVLSNTSLCCSNVISLGFSWLYPWRPISWPESRIRAHSEGKVSRLWPGMNQVAVMLCFEKRDRRRRVPIVPAKRPWMPGVSGVYDWCFGYWLFVPRLMSLLESSPP